MLRERQYVFLRLNLLLDMALSVLALVAAYYTRSVLAAAYTSWQAALPAWIPEIVPYDQSHLLREYLWLWPTCAVLWPLALNRWGYYDWYDLGGVHDRKVTILKASVLSAAFLILAVFVFKQQFIARLVVVGTGVWATLLLWLKEAVVHRAVVRLHATPEYEHAVVVIADQAAGDGARRLVEQNRPWGARLARWIDLATITAERLEEDLTQQPVDEVVVAPAPEHMARLPALIYVCEQLGVTIRILADVYRPHICTISTDCVDGVPVIELHSTTRNFAALTFKVFFDRTAALLLLLLLLPLLAVIAVLVKLTSPGPAFIAQRRVGQNGRVFTMYKFRSMVVDAEAMRPALDADNELQGWAFKMRHDPRVTRFGRILRRFSLDELPQLWNVLIGDMSLVGPRPALPDEVAKFQLWERRRFSMKPGMSGLWQVSGRTELPSTDWVACDLTYIDTWSLALDLRILLKTIAVVVRGQGY